MLQRISKRFTDICVVAASGPSLTHDVADGLRGRPVVAISDAWRLVPFADVLYAPDAEWWDYHKGCRDFGGERWSSHSLPNNDKLEAAERHGLSLVRGIEGEGFSLDPKRIHYGSNAGFQGINLAIHMLGGRGRVILVGFDMRVVCGRHHFFVEHPPAIQPVAATDDKYRRWFHEFKRAAQLCPPAIEIINATPDSALPYFRMMPLRDAVRLSETV